MRDEQMTVTISDEDAAFVREQVERRGADVSADDVMAEAIKLLKEREARLSRIRAEIQAARDDPRRYSQDEIEADLENLFQEYSKAAAE